MKGLCMWGQNLSEHFNVRMSIYLSDMASDAWHMKFCSHALAELHCRGNQE